VTTHVNVRTCRIECEKCRNFTVSELDAHHLPLLKCYCPQSDGTKKLEAESTSYQEDFVSTGTDCIRRGEATDPVIVTPGRLRAQLPLRDDAITSHFSARKAASAPAADRCL